MVYVAVVDKRTYFFPGFGVFLLNLTLSYNPMQGFSQLHVPGGVEPICEDAYGQVGWCRSIESLSDPMEEI